MGFSWNHVVATGVRTLVVVCSTGIENDTASDIPFINITKKNKQEEESSKRNSKEKDSLEGENKNKNGETKTRIPEFEVIKHFFEQNQSSTD
jgi:hypothetical protein